MDTRGNTLEEKFHTFLDILSKDLKDMPAVEKVSMENKEVEERAFKVLLSTILSARTKDEITLEVSKRLFENVGQDPARMQQFQSILLSHILHLS